MSLFKDLYYIIVSDGVPVDVQTEWAAAQASSEQFKTSTRTASILPVRPITVDEFATDFAEEEDTRPMVPAQMDFDFSDVTVQPRNPEVI